MSYILLPKSSVSDKITLHKSNTYQCTPSKTVYNTLQCSSHLRHIKSLCNILHIPTLRAYRSFAAAVSQLKICDFSGETFKGFEVLEFSMSATTTQQLSSSEFCKLRYDTIPVKSASANASFYTNNSKMTNFEL